MIAVFRSTASAPGWPGHVERSGQTVEVVRQLTEADGVEPEAGRMYLVRFDDGVEAHAFEEELS